MTDRAHLLIDFIGQNKWGDAIRHPISGDASFRRYERLQKGDKTVILMDAPPPKEDVRPFIHIDGYLRRRDLNAPEIYAQDEKNGFLLLEDFGDDIFTNVLSGKSPLSNKYDEIELYSAAIDVLVDLHRSSLPREIPGYNDVLLREECELLTDWYLPGIGLKSNVKDITAEYIDIWEELFPIKDITDDVVVLRDYHADNLIWLPEREGVHKVGLLDFQDAVIGSPVYDLVSLLEDARRDVNLLTVSAMIDRYVDTRIRVNREEFMAAYSIMAAHRNCKIVGIFARLAVRDGKPQYLNYLPRVWKHIEYDISHPILSRLKKWLNQHVPKSLRKPESFKVIKPGRKS